MKPELSDADLARWIASGDSATSAETLLYERFARRVELYGLRHLGSRGAAEDLVQQVMLAVLLSIRAGRLEDPGALASFVLGTCRNVTWDTRRAEQRQRAIERQAVVLDFPVEPPSSSAADLMRLFGCVGKLPQREASVIRMTFMEDRAADEIAERLELTAGNVRVLRHRALAKLAVCMGVEVSS